MANGPFHSVGSRCQNEFRAELGEQGPAFESHIFGHGEGEFISLRSSVEGKHVASIAGGRFDDPCAARSNQTFGLGIFNHGEADPVFDASKGIPELTFEDDGRSQSRSDAIEAD